MVDKLEAVEVTQADREAAWKYRPACYWLGDDTMEKWMNGAYDAAAPVIADFARHRLASATPANGEQVERITPALHEGGRFLAWSSVDLAAQCLAQAREQLDPEFSQFMTAVAARLASTPTEEARSRVKALEEAAQVAERDVDWTTFAKSRVEQWEDGPDPLRDYRLGINVGSVIAAAIRARAQHDHEVG